VELPYHTQLIRIRKKIKKKKKKLLNEIEALESEYPIDFNILDENRVALENIRSEKLQFF
jgi:hypothetical protein